MIHFGIWRSLFGWSFFSFWRIIISVSSFQLSNYKTVCLVKVVLPSSEESYLGHPWACDQFCHIFITKPMIRFWMIICLSSTTIITSFSSEYHISRRYNLWWTFSIYSVYVNSFSILLQFTSSRRIWAENFLAKEQRLFIVEPCDRVFILTYQLGRN